MTSPSVRLIAATFIVLSLARTPVLADEIAQELPPPPELPAAPPPESAPDELQELQRRLAETESKLRTALRSYALLEARTDKIAAEAEQRQRESDEASTRLLNDARVQADKAVREAHARLETVSEELRHTQAQLLTVSEENSRLKTKLALVGAPPGAPLHEDSPTRPGATLPPASPASDPNAAAPTAVDITLSSAPPPAGGSREHVVALGENLARISELYYGTPTRWEEIFNANRDVLADADVISAGAKIRIP